jgi:hypothetical protein
VQQQLLLSCARQWMSGMLLRGAAGRAAFFLEGLTGVYLKGAFKDAVLVTPST